MACKIQTKADLDRAFVDGWSLYPARMSNNYTLQKGVPGHGGQSLTVTYRAVTAFLKDHSVTKLGGPYDWYYVRQGKV